MTSLERELRGDDDGHEIPAAYADLAEATDEDPASERYEDLRQSG